MLTDRVHRVRLLTLLVAIWSGLTALCSVATSFWHLAVARLGVGAAEAGGSPISASILSDIFPPHRRAFALSVFYAGAPVGGFISLLVGGYVAQHYGWRAVFLIYGAPGLLLAALIYLTIREPVRGTSNQESAATGWGASMRVLFAHPTIRWLVFGSMLFTLSISAVMSWLVPLLTRAHGMDLTTSGAVVGTAGGVCGTIGALFIGACSDRCRRVSASGPIFVLAILAFFNAAFGLGAVVAQSELLCIGLLLGWGFTTSASAAPVMAQLSELAPAGSKGIAFSVFAVSVNLVGAGLGPVAVGLISDLTTALAGPATALRYGLMVAAGVNFGGALAFLHAARRRTQLNLAAATA
jgi:predicted MFS family arabinose efflux permease